MKVLVSGLAQWGIWLEEVKVTVTREILVKLPDAEIEARVLKRGEMIRVLSLSSFATSLGPHHLHIAFLAIDSRPT